MSAEKNSAQNNTKNKKLLLLRAAFDFDSLDISQQKKTRLQKLIQESPLEAELGKKFQLAVLNSTAIKPSDEFKKLQKAWKENSNYFHEKSVPDIIILVSKHATLLARQVLPKTWFEQAQVFSVGRASLVFFEEDKITITCPTLESGEGLMNLPALEKINNKTVLICKGELGLDFIENECKKRGAKVNTLNLYSRVQSAKTLLDEIPKVEALDYLFATSVFALEHFKNSISTDKRMLEAFLNRPVLVLSERIGNKAKQMGFLKVEVYEDRAG